VAKSPGVFNVVQGKVSALTVSDRFPKDIVFVVDNSGTLVS
jgi:hypothetical protein